MNQQRRRLNIFDAVLLTEMILEIYYELQVFDKRNS